MEDTTTTSDTTSLDSTIDSILNGDDSTFADSLTGPDTMSQALEGIDGAPAPEASTPPAEGDVATTGVENPTEPSQTGADFDINALVEESTDDLTDKTNAFAMNIVDDIVKKFRLSGSPTMLRTGNTWGIFDDLLYKYWEDNIYLDEGDVSKVYRFKRWLNSKEFDDVYGTQDWKDFVAKNGDIIISRLIDSRYINNDDKLKFVSKDELKNKNTLGDISPTETADSTAFSDTYTPSDESPISVDIL